MIITVDKDNDDDDDYGDDDDHDDERLARGGWNILKMSIVNQFIDDHCDESLW